jgi:hypothetical protein
MNMIKRKLSNTLAKRRFARLSTDPSGAGNTCIVYGNCQADAIRILLESSPTFPLRTVSLPAVHELTPDEADVLRDILPHVAAFVTHPIKAGYRNLGLGSEELAAIVTGHIVKIVPLFYQGLYPFQVRVRFDGHAAPLTLYDDLRFLYCAANGWDSDLAGRWLTTYEAPTAVLGELAEESRCELARRERDLAVDVHASHWIADPDIHARGFFTVDHPATVLLDYVAAGICGHLGYDYNGNSNGELLGIVRTPLEPSVCAALQLDVQPSCDWRVERTIYSQNQMLQTHLEYYSARPELVKKGVAQHSERMARLALEIR